WSVLRGAAAISGGSGRTGAAGRSGRRRWIVRSRRWTHSVQARLGDRNAPHVFLRAYPATRAIRRACETGEQRRGELFSGVSRRGVQLRRKVGWVEPCEAPRHRARWASLRSTHPTSCQGNAISMKTDKRELAILGGPRAFDEPLHVGRPNLGDRSKLLERIEGILDRRWLSNQGPLVTEFEMRVA